MLQKCSSSAHKKIPQFCRNLKLFWICGVFLLPRDKVGVIWGESDIKNPGSVSAQCAGQVGMLPVQQQVKFIRANKCFFLFSFYTVFWNLSHIFLRVYILWMSMFGTDYSSFISKEPKLIDKSIQELSAELTRHIFWCSRRQRRWPGAGSRGRMWGIWWAWRDLKREETVTQ